MILAYQHSVPMAYQVLCNSVRAKSVGGGVYSGYHNAHMALSSAECPVHVHSQQASREKAVPCMPLSKCLQPRSFVTEPVADDAVGDMRIQSPSVTSDRSYLTDRRSRYQYSVGRGGKLASFIHTAVNDMKLQHVCNLRINWQSQETGSSERPHRHLLSCL